MRCAYLLDRHGGVLQVFYPSSSSDRKNRGIEAIAATGLGNKNKWNSSVVAFASQGPVERPRPRDMDMDDYHCIAGYLLNNKPQRTLMTRLGFYRRHIFSGLIISFVCWNVPAWKGDPVALMALSIGTLFRFLFAVLISIGWIALIILLAVGVLLVFCMSLSKVLKWICTLLDSVAAWILQALMEFW
jgi:hypothetical protein